MKKNLILALSLTFSFGFVCTAKKADKPSAGLHDVKVTTIDGKTSSLEAYEGKVLLVVNVASQCGLTKQYKDLEALHRKYKDKGFTVLGWNMALQVGRFHDVWVMTHRRIADDPRDPIPPSAISENGVLTR